MQLNFKQLEITFTIGCIDLHRLLVWEASKKIIKKMNLSFWKVMRFEVLALYCLASSIWLRKIRKATRHSL